MAIKLSKEQIFKLRTAFITQFVEESGEHHQKYQQFSDSVLGPQKHAFTRLIQHICMSIMVDERFGQDTVLPEQAELMSYLFQALTEVAQQSDTDISQTQTFEAVVLHIVDELAVVHQALQKTDEYICGDDWNLLNEHSEDKLKRKEDLPDAKEMLFTVNLLLLKSPFKTTVDQLPLIGEDVAPVGKPKIINGNLSFGIVNGIFKRVNAKLISPPKLLTQKQKKVKANREAYNLEKAKYDSRVEAMKSPDYNRVKATELFDVLMEYLNAYQHKLAMMAAIEDVQRHSKTTPTLAAPIHTKPAIKLRQVEAKGFSDRRIEASLAMFWDEQTKAKADSDWYRHVQIKLPESADIEQAKQAFSAVYAHVAKRSSSRQLLVNHKKLMPQILGVFLVQYMAADCQPDKFNVAICADQHVINLIQSHRKASFADKVVGQLDSSKIFRTLVTSVDAKKQAVLQTIMQHIVRRYAQAPHFENVLNRDRNFLPQLVEFAVHTIQQPEFKIVDFNAEHWIDAFNACKKDGHNISQRAIINRFRKKGVTAIINGEVWRQTIAYFKITEESQQMAAQRVLFTLSKLLAMPPLVIDLNRQTQDILGIALGTIGRCVFALKEADWVEEKRNGKDTKVIQSATANHIAEQAKSDIIAQLEQHRRQQAQRFAGRAMEKALPLFAFDHRQLLLAEHYTSDLLISPTIEKHGTTFIDAVDISHAGVDNSRGLFELDAEGFITHHIKNPAVNHVLFPVGDNSHWRAVHLDLTGLKRFFCLNRHQCTLTSQTF